MKEEHYGGRGWGWGLVKNVVVEREKECTGGPGHDCHKKEEKASHSIDFCLAGSGTYGLPALFLSSHARLLHSSLHPILPELAGSGSIYPNRP